MTVETKTIRAIELFNGDVYATDKDLLEWLKGRGSSGVAHKILFGYNSHRIVLDKEKGEFIVDKSQKGYEIIINEKVIEFIHGNMVARVHYSYNYMETQDND